jgi:hypothetical protein|nr:MAG TPA: protein of unknown function (DUF5320) [Bacteriophage sp.]
MKKNIEFTVSTQEDKSTVEYLLERLDEVESKVEKLEKKIKKLEKKRDKQ